MDFLKGSANQNQNQQPQGEQKDGRGFMGKINNALGGDQNQQGQEEQKSGGGFMGKANNALGGGQSGEAKEDRLDKAVDFVQEHGLGSGQQTDESATEQKKDEYISDSIRNQYKNVTGREFPIADK